MGSSLSSRSEEERQRIKERFTPLMYQLKKSGESSSGNHTMKCDIIGQEVGAYPYPKEDRGTGNDFPEEEEETPIRKTDLPPCGLLS